MDGRRFDSLAKGLAAATTRRVAIKGLGVGVLGAVLGRVGLEDAAAQVEAAGNRVEGERCANTRQCRPGLRCCDRRCRNIRTDNRHCGRCNVNCRGGGRACRNGGCFATCRGAAAGVCDINGCGGRCGCNHVHGGGGLNVCEFTGDRCEVLDACNSDADCGFGRTCVDEGCCGGKPRVCTRPCVVSSSARRATVSAASEEQREP